MPAFVNINVGSFLATMDDDGTKEWLFSLKKFMKLDLIKLEFIKIFLIDRIFIFTK